MQRPPSPVAAPRWAVVATISEPAALALAFAAWHRGIGAAEVHVFLDRPDPEAEAALAALPGVFVTVCDADFWAARPGGRRPESVNRRQALNAALAAERTEADWLLHCDADEFVADGAVLAAALAAAPAEARALRLLPVERVRRTGLPPRGIFDGIFRRPAFDFGDWGETTYGRYAKFLQVGLTGHGVGKTIFRPKAGLRPGIHFVRDAAGEIVQDGNLRDLLLHFDGLTPTHFLLKLAARSHLPQYNAPNNPDGPIRDHQVRFLRNHAGAPDKLAAFAQGLQAVTPEQEAALALRDRLVATGFDPAPVFAAMGVAPDLSVAAFDAALRARFAPVIAETGLILPEVPA